MKHIPIMLALALSISLTSYEGNTRTSSNNINATEEISIKTNTINSNLSDEELTLNLEYKS